MRFFNYLTQIIESEGTKPLFINGMEDHVHLLLAMPLTILIPDLMAKIKPVSTKWFRTTFPQSSDFAWQQGYGAFSVGKSNLSSVIKYIENQEEHHRKMTFEEEFKQLLQLQGIKFDPKYVLG